MKHDTKDLIINTTINLIQHMDGKTDSITIREISKAANIAVSQINYHFQSKENLIDQCIQKMISSMIFGLEKFVEASNMSNIDKLEHVIDLIYSYLYESENLARISILSDHRSPQSNDNTSQTLRVWNPLIEEICKERNIAKPKLLGTLLIQGLQGVFLRTDLIQQELGIDLHDEISRNLFIHNILESYFGEF